MANANVVLFDPAKRPSYALANQGTSTLTKSLAGGGGGFPGKRISIKGGVFRLIADGKEVASIEERYLDVVFVRSAEHIGRTYYSKAFSDDSPVAPDCWSSDGTKPDASVQVPQSPQCATCHQNAKGSGVDDTRACRFSQRVAVVLANDLEGDVLQLSVPAASLFGKEEGDNMPLQAYARKLSAANIKIEQVITRLKFDVKAPSPKLFFKGMRWLEEEEFAIIEKQGQTPDAIQACIMTVAQMDKVVNVPQPPAPVASKTDDDEEAPPPAPKAKTAPAPEVDEEAPPPPPKRGRGRPPKNQGVEPTVRTAAAAPEIPKKSAAADLVSRWSNGETDD